MLQAQLWNHFETHIREAMEAKAIQSENWELLDEIRQQRNWEVMDINFAKSTNIDMDILIKMDLIDREKKTIINDIKKLKKEDKEVPEAINTKVAELVKNYNDIKRIYVEIQNDNLYEKWELN